LFYVISARALFFKREYLRMKANRREYFER
jgi:hypothetical protein